MKSINGEFGGIGATVSKKADEDEILISEVYEGSPA